MNYTYKLIDLDNTTHEINLQIRFKSGNFFYNNKLYHIYKVQENIGNDYLILCKEYLMKLNTLKILMMIN